MLAAAFALVAIAGGVLVATSRESVQAEASAVIPHRVSVPPTPTASPKPSPSPTPVAPDVCPNIDGPQAAVPDGDTLIQGDCTSKVAASAPLEVSIPGVLDVLVGGSITAQTSSHCRSVAPCLFPPEANGAYRQAWWFNYTGEPLPAVPQASATYILGHSYRFQKDAAFNNLPTTQVGDVVTVRTQAGIIRYKVTRTAQVPFGSITDASFGVFPTTLMPNTLVLITCALRDKVAGQVDPPPADNNGVIWAEEIGAES